MKVIILTRQGWHPAQLPSEGSKEGPGTGASASKDLKRSLGSQRRTWKMSFKRRTCNRSCGCQRRSWKRSCGSQRRTGNMSCGTQGPTTFGPLPGATSSELAVSGSNCCCHSAAGMWDHSFGRTLNPSSKTVFRPPNPFSKGDPYKKFPIGDNTPKPTDQNELFF